MKYEVIGWTNPDDPSFEECSSEIQRYLIPTLIREIREKGYRISGASHICRCVPVFNSGEKFSVSDRVWGSIMAEALGEDNSDGMAYAKWLFIGICDDDENLPELKVDRSRLARPGSVLQYDDIFCEGPSHMRPVGNVVKELHVSRKFMKKHN